MNLPDLVKRTTQLADMEDAAAVGKFTLYRSEGHYPIPCFLELNCKNDSYLVYFGLYYDVFRFRFHEGKILFKGDLRSAQNYIEADLIKDIAPLKKASPAEFLARATPMPWGDMGMVDDAFIDSVRKFDGAATMEIIGKMDMLGTSDKPAAVEALKPFLRHRRASIRMHALTALLTLRSAPDAEKLRALLEMIEDCDPMIRELASYCGKLIFKITPYKDPPPPAEVVQNPREV
jgi:hypothetical protein